MKFPFRTNADYDVVGVGRNSWDRIALVASYPPRNAKVEILETDEQPGGQVATTLVTAARLGARVRYLGKFGGDDHGRHVRDALIREKIDVSVCHRLDEVPNQHAFIVVDRAQKTRNVFVASDPRLKATSSEFPPEIIGSGKILYLGGRDPKAAVPFAQIGKNAGCTIVVDADAVGDGVFELLPLVDVMICPEDVPSRLIGERSLDRALDILSRMGPGMVVCTKGAQGACAVMNGEFIEVPSYSVNVIDTTGAGDVFQGALLVGLIEGWEPRKLLEFANASAALKCRSIGGQRGIPSRQEVEAFLHSAR